MFTASSFGAFTNTHVYAYPSKFSQYGCFLLLPLQMANFCMVLASCEPVHSLLGFGLLPPRILAGVPAVAPAHILYPYPYAKQKPRHVKHHAGLQFDVQTRGTCR